MRRRTFLQSTILGAGVGLAAQTTAPSLKIKRIRFYEPPNARPTFNQATGIVTVETDQGLTGIGEGGTKETVEQCAAMLIGTDASRIEHLWQFMYRGYFYPPGREKLHALGAIDLALWDLKGKALGVPVHELLGGLTREHIECYSTAFPSKGNPGETARACIEAGFRAYRTSVSDAGRGQPFDARQAVDTTHQSCRKIREAIGPEGDWAIDYHTRLDLSDAIRLSSLIQDLNPYFAEDLVRSENTGVYRTIRQQVRLPIAVGEHFGDRWDSNELIEEHLIDYSRVTLPNAGGITEYVKHRTLCETHYIGLIPHFTGPVATAALAHVCGSFSGPVLMEILGERPADQPHLPLSYDFRDGKVWPNRRPGLGVEFNPAAASMLTEVTEPYHPIPTLRRKDGSFTNW